MKSKLLIIFLIVVIIKCGDNDPITTEDINYRQEMRDFIIDISNYAKSINNNFLIIPQNGQELITNSGEADGAIQTEYLTAIDATGRESMFYGYYADNEETPFEDQQHLLELCLLCEQNNIEVLTTDYCSTKSKINNSYLINEQNGFISFAADERNLNNIPNYPALPYNVNSNNIEHISDAQNFLYLINSENFNTKTDFINTVSQTNYDLIIMDLYHNETAFTLEEVEKLRIKNNGSKRLVICYLSIGEAEDYRYYWQQSWKTDKPAWLEPENPNWEGNYKVKYWHIDWQNIIYGNNNSYLKKILDAGFDGVYLDIIDGFEYFEEK